MIALNKEVIRIKHEDDTYKIYRARESDDFQDQVEDSGKTKRAGQVLTVKAVSSKFERVCIGELVIEANLTKILRKRGEHH